MNNLKQMICAAAAVIMLPLGMTGQETLTLEQCRDMAIQNNKALDQARTKVEMAGYDRKIARANYYPNISATGAYMYNQKSIALINDELSDKLTGTGAAIQGKVNEKVTSIVEAISKLPNGSEILQSHHESRHRNRRPPPPGHTQSVRRCSIAAAARLHGRKDCQCQQNGKTGRRAFKSPV